MQTSPPDFVPYEGCKGVWVQGAKFDGKQSTFGYFICNYCEKRWMSAHSKKGFKQGCKSCKREFFAVYLWKNFEKRRKEKDEENEEKALEDNNKPHMRHLCQACRKEFKMFSQPVPENVAPTNFLVEVRIWWDKTPVFSKFLVYSSIFFHFLSWLKTDYPLMLNNTPYFTVFSFEVFRLFSCYFVNLSLAQLVLTLMLILPMVTEKESTKGTLRFMFDFISENLALQVLFLFVCMLLGLVSKSFLLFQSSGLWSFYFIHVTIVCMQSPEEPTNILCLPIQIKSKFYPFLLFILISLIFSSKIHLDIILGILLGVLMYRLSFMNFQILNDDKILALERSPYLELLVSRQNFIHINDTHNMSMEQPLYSNSNSSQLYQNPESNSQPSTASDAFSGIGIQIGHEEGYKEIHFDHEIRESDDKQADTKNEGPKEMKENFLLRAE